MGPKLIIKIVRPQIKEALGGKMGACPGNGHPQGKDPHKEDQKQDIVVQQPEFGEVQIDVVQQYRQGDQGDQAAQHPQFYIGHDKGPAYELFGGPYHLHGLDDKAFGIYGQADGAVDQQAGDDGKDHTGPQDPKSHSPGIVVEQADQGLVVAHFVHIGPFPDFPGDLLDLQGGDKICLQLYVYGVLEGVVAQKFHKVFPDVLTVLFGGILLGNILCRFGVLGQGEAFLKLFDFHGLGILLEEYRDGDLFLEVVAQLFGVQHQKPQGAEQEEDQGDAEHYGKVGGNQFSALISFNILAHSVESIRKNRKVNRI